MRGFTLLELVIVLAVISVVLSLTFPAIYRRSLDSPDVFNNRAKSLLESLFSLGRPEEICVDFRKGELSVGKERLELPYPAESLVLPGRLVSGELVNRYCFEPYGFGYFVLNLRKGEGSYLSLFTLLPSGQTLFLSLNQAQEETLKDKVEKGRITEWFSYYSF